MDVKRVAVGGIVCIFAFQQSVFLFDF